jgi:hypothetical protein
MLIFRALFSTSNCFFLWWSSDLTSVCSFSVWHYGFLRTGVTLRLGIPLLATLELGAAFLTGVARLLDIRLGFDFGAVTFFCIPLIAISSALFLAACCGGVRGLLLDAPLPLPLAVGIEGPLGFAGGLPLPRGPYFLGCGAGLPLPLNLGKEGG